MIQVQREDFDLGAVLTAMTDKRSQVGAQAVFIGLVRDMADNENVEAMTLEHYPGMTERQLEAIEAEARQRWPLDDVLIIHRYGRLLPNERIVLCAATSAHRQAALEACQFLIDWLKTKAPFWKCEEHLQGRQWVAARAGDDSAAERWDKE